MNKNLLLVPICMGLAVLTAQAAEQTAAEISAAVRSARKTSLTLGFNSLIRVKESDQAAVMPFPNLQLDLNLTPHVALSASLQSVVVMNTVLFGGKVFFLQGRFSPYLKAGVGLTFVPEIFGDGGQEDRPWFTVQFGGGVDLAFYSGFSLYVEAGGWLWNDNTKIDLGPAVTVGVGYRF